MIQTENQEIIKLSKDKYSSTLRELEKVNSNIKMFLNNKNNLKEQEQKAKSLLKYEEQQLSYFQSLLSKNENEQLKIIAEQKKYESEIVKLEESIQKETISISSLESKLEQFDTKKIQFGDEYRQEMKLLEEKFIEINESEGKLGSYKTLKKNIVQDLYTFYNLTEIEAKEQFQSQRIHFDKEKQASIELKKTITSLGIINPLAIEEFESIKKIYDHNSKQLQDIIEAQKQILEVIESSKIKSTKMFLETFAQIEKNFLITFKKLFNGGETLLTLLDPNQALVSGIEIQVQPPGKKSKSLRLLSGGEKALTAIALMFAIYMVKSSPICVLDEIDAPLDDQNVLRFLTLLKEFQENTQFILITHNKKTMSHSDVLFGITMQEPGVSKILGTTLR